MNIDTTSKYRTITSNNLMTIPNPKILLRPNRTEFPRIVILRSFETLPLVGADDVWSSNWFRVDGKVDWFREADASRAVPAIRELFQQTWARPCWEVDVGSTANVELSLLNYYRITDTISTKSICGKVKMVEAGIRIMAVFVKVWLGCSIDIRISESVYGVV